MNNGIILTVNIGSASKKYALYIDGKRVLDAHLEHEEKWSSPRRSELQLREGGYLASWNIGGVSGKKTVTSEEFARAAAVIVEMARKEKLLVGKFDVIGIRVVAPGIYFTEHREIDYTYLAKLESAQELAPLHVAATLAEIKELRRLFPDTPLVGASDSAFHKTMPDVARRYALPESLVKEYELYRYGYHGLSFQSAAKKLSSLQGGIPARAVICHLGSGSSITALANGRSIDTTMGFTPLEGLPMATRSGSIDPGAVIFLAEKLGLTPRELEKKLNGESGLLGVSQLSSDIRELLKAEKKGNESAKLALDLFVYNVRKQIGAMAAALGGIDALVFTGTVGERSNIMRKRIVENLKFLKISLSPHANNHALGGVDAVISKTTARVSVHVFVADEAAEIERITNELA